jgi:DNA-binding transcriptional MocR family regulator
MTVTSRPTLYASVADRILAMIETGTLQAGERIPSVRVLSRRMAVSVNTIREAYTLLESQRFLEARPQSGWYVRRRVPPLPQKPLAATLDPREVTMCRIYNQVLESGGGGASLAIALPDSALLPAEKLNRAFGRSWKDLGQDSLAYQVSPGLPALRHEIARHSLEGGLEVGPDQIIITSGGSEAIYLAVLALCRPGDTLAVETPTYFNFLHLLLELGIRVVEIPCDPTDGVNLDDLRQALESHPVKAFLSIPHFNNPLGGCLTEDKGRALVTLLDRFEVPLIEDDLYGELPFAGRRPVPLKAYDTSGRNILVSSFSKTLAPGYRIGWIIPGRWYPAVDRLKTLSSVATNTPSQLAIAQYLATGGYERHLRTFRKALALQTGLMAETVAETFPTGTKVSRPAGGFVLWIELPGGTDTLDLYDRTVAEGIAFSPGAIFSASGRFGNCLRLSAGVWNQAVETAVKRIGGLAVSLEKGGN